MTKKNSDITIDFDYWWGDSLSKNIIKRFKSFLIGKESRDEILKNSEKINWNALVNFCLNQINDLIKTTKIPETVDGVDMFNWYSKVYTKTIFQFLEYQIFNTMFNFLKEIDDTTSKARKDLIIKRGVKESKELIIFTIEILKYQVDVSAMKWIKDSETIKIEMKKLEKYADWGKKFYGKQFRTDEIKQFDKIEQKYIQAKNDGLKRSYKTIASFIARTELEMHQEVEQVLFYKRFLRYKKRKK